MKLPTCKDINIYDSLEEIIAVEHFLGKSLEEAEKLFGQNSLYYQEDLMWMGPVAFRFYVQSAIRYIQSEAASGDSDMINCFADTLEFRLEHESQELQPVAVQLATICGYVLVNLDRFDVDAEIYDGIRDSYTLLQQSFEQLV